MAQRRNNGNRKFTIFAIQLLPRIKTVADPRRESDLHRLVQPLSLSPVAVRLHGTTPPAA